MPSESDRGSSLPADDANVNSNSNFIALDDHQAKVSDALLLQKIRRSVSQVAKIQGVSLTYNTNSSEEEALVV